MPYETKPSPDGQVYVIETGTRCTVAICPNAIVARRVQRGLIIVHELEAQRARRRDHAMRQQRLAKQRRRRSAYIE